MYKSALGICLPRIWGGNAPWHFILFITVESCNGKRDLSSVIIILWENIYIGVGTVGNLATCLAKKGVNCRIKRLHLNVNPYTAALCVPWPWMRNEGKSENCKYNQVTATEWMCFGHVARAATAFLCADMLSARERRTHNFFFLRKWFIVFLHDFK